MYLLLQLLQIFDKSVLVGIREGVREFTKYLSKQLDL